MAQSVLYTRRSVYADDSSVTLRRAESVIAVSVGENTDNVSVTWRIL